MEWIKTENEQPRERTLVVGLWQEQAMLCYRSGTQWFDVFHGCKCYCTPKYFAYLPDGLIGER